jgi:ubiquinone/menaquinone biosynthesis C-methylase UbiE
MNVGCNDMLALLQSNEFERIYIELRNHERRMYSDEEVAWLPDIADDHIHKKEWDIRRNSCKKLLGYLSNKRRSLKILEVGCGNGWLSYQLSQIRFSNVIGLDINLPELQQAERVFNAIPNLTFVHGDLSAVEFEKFDIVVFAASIQYFRSIDDVIDSVLDLLNPRGEIHFVDSHFYSDEKIKSAEQRSRRYFHENGFDRMLEFYFHHSLEELKRFNYRVKYDPGSILNRLIGRNPFHWIRIKK